MDQIKWCLNQKKGIELIEPSDNLRDAYLVKAEEALDTLRTSKSRDWQLTLRITLYIMESILCL